VATAFFARAVGSVPQTPGTHPDLPAEGHYETCRNSGSTGRSAGATRKSARHCAFLRVSPFLSSGLGCKHERSGEGSALVVAFVLSEYQVAHTDSDFFQRPAMNSVRSECVESFVRIFGALCKIKAKRAVELEVSSNNRATISCVTFYSYGICGVMTFWVVRLCHQGNLRAWGTMQRRGESLD
jgi:hypothetical protein